MIKNVKILQGHEGAIYKVVFDPVHRKLYSVGGEGWLVEWDVEDSDDGTLLAKVPDQVFSLAVTPKYYLMGSFQGNFYVLDRNDKSIMHQERAHKHGVFSILADSPYFYTFGGDGHIIQWSEDTFEKTRSISLSSKSLRSQTLNAEKDRLAVGGSDGKIYLLSFPELFLRKQIDEAHDPTVFTLAWLDDQLVSGGRDALLKTWNINKEFTLDKTINAHWYAIYDIAITPDYLITGSRDKSIRWWNRHTLDPVGTVKWGDVMEAHVHSVNSLTVDDKNQVVYSGSEDRTIRGWVVDG